MSISANSIKYLEAITPSCPNWEQTKNWCLPPGQAKTIIRLFEEMDKKHAGLGSYKKIPMSGSSSSPGNGEGSVGTWTTFFYPGPVSYNGTTQQGLYEESLSCHNKIEKGKSWEPSCEWKAQTCLDSSAPCETKQEIQFDLNDPSQSIPTNNVGNIPLYSGTKAGLTLVAATISTAYFTYKAFKEVFKLYKESQQKPGEKAAPKSEENQLKSDEQIHADSKMRLRQVLERSRTDSKEGQSQVVEKSRPDPKEKASAKRAVAYAAAAIGSGAYTIYTYNDLRS